MSVMGSLVSSRRRVVSGAAVIAALVASGAGLLGARGAQQTVPPAPPSPAPAASTPQEPPRPTFRVEANYVRVDAYITRDGVPVTDLTADDFEVFEDNVPQKVDTFERVQVVSAGPSSERREPSTRAESLEMAANPRARVFVIFLDIYHTDMASSRRIRSSLVKMLDRIIGAEDLIGFMTPQMTPDQVTLARRTQTLEALLDQAWPWGVRDSITYKEPEEQQWEMCYPTPPEGRQCAGPDQVLEMIERSREERILTSLDDLAVWLRGVREERKAVIAVSSGWKLFGPSQQLARLPSCGGTGPSPFEPGVGPTGRLTPNVSKARGEVTNETCELARARLAQIDNYRTFIDMMGRANRANVSFYPIDAGGLRVFDTGLGDASMVAGATRQPLPPAQDQAQLSRRIDSLRTLAENTDGMAVVNTNNIDGALKRIIDDLTSYYLLGYYSTNPATDGRFRTIKVRVKRPGVEVRARKGYRAATPEEVSARATAPGATAATPPSAVATAVNRLGAARGDQRMFTHASWLAPGAPAVSAAQPGSATSASANRGWLVTEVDATFARSADFQGGAEVTITLSGPDGTTVTERTTQLPAGERMLVTELTDVTFTAGEYTVRTRLRPAAGGLAISDLLRFRVEPGSPVGAARLLRRGPATGPTFRPTADPRFTRNERVRVEVPSASPATTARGELLDRLGKTLAYP